MKRVAMSTMYGVPIYVSETVDPGSIWLVAPPVSPGDPPTVVRLCGLRIDDIEPEPPQFDAEQTP